MPDIQPAPFFYIDKRSFSLFRILISLVLIHDYLVRLSDYSAHYSNNGVLPLAVVKEFFHPVGTWSLLFLNSNNVFGLAVFIAGIVCAGAMLCGYRSRMMAFLNWVIILSIQNRNPLIYQGGDDLLRMAVFWFIFINPDNADDQGRLNGLPVAVLLLQVLFPFFFSGLSKGLYEWWQQGTALNYALQLDQIARPLALWLRNYPAVTEWLTRIVFLGEVLVLPIFLLPVAREYIRFIVFILLLCFSLGLMCLFMIGVFPICILACSVLFLPTSFWQWIGWDKYRQNVVKGKSDNLVPLFHTWGRDFVIMYLFIVVCWWNIADLSALRFPESIRPIAYILKLNQSWGVFAPSVFKEDGWIILNANLNNGQEIDINNGSKVVDFNKPAYVLDRFKNDRWRKYSEQILLRTNETFRPYYADYITNTYNEHKKVPEQIRQLRIYYMLEYTSTTGTPPNIQKLLLYQRGSNN